jgi:hypothetical protein
LISLSLYQVSTEPVLLWYILRWRLTGPLQGFTQARGGDPFTLPVNFNSTEAHPKDFENLFFCWGNSNFPQNSNFTCNSFSPSFTVAASEFAAPEGLPGTRPSKRIDDPKAHLLPRFSGNPTTTLLVQSISGVLSMSGAPILSVPEVTRISTSTLLETVTPSVPATAKPTAASSASASAATAEAATAVESNSKLATGAIVGIGVGGAAFLLLLAFVAFACIRRRRRSSPPQGKHMLLQSTTDATSRERSQRTPPEKAFTPAPTKSFLQTRPASGFDYPRLSLLYSGLAAASPRNSTAAPAASGAIAVIPENMSEISGPVSPRSTLRSVAIFSEPYEDMPAPYTDERQPHLSSQTPFLSEPGMSAEELSRLEEEERRIDAAIAEAERHR